MKIRKQHSSVFATRFTIQGANSTTLLRVLQADGTSVLNVDTTNAKVGIGNVLPQSRLHVTGDFRLSKVNAYSEFSLQREDASISGGDDLGRINFTGDDASAVNTEGCRIVGEADGSWSSGDTPGRLTFWTTTDGTETPAERMRIDSSGYVGINTTTPEVLFDVTSGGAGVFVRFNASDGINIVDFSESAGGDGQMILRNTGGTTKINFNAGGDSYINNGNVGIGVTDPDTLLELYKVGTQLKLSGGAADYATFAVAADGALTITTVDTDAAEGDIILAPDGNVGINKTNPTAFFHVVGPATMDIYSASRFEATTDLNLSSGGQYNAHQFRATATAPGTGAKELITARYNAYYTGTVNKTSGDIMGFYATVSVSSTSAVTVVKGSANVSQINVYGSANVLTNAYYCNAVPPYLAHGGTILNLYGYYIPDGWARGTSSNWGVYIADASADNYFAGKVGIGVADPDTKLEILNAGNQLKLSFDGTDNAIFAVDTNGDLTITPSGTSILIPSKLAFTQVDLNEYIDSLADGYMDYRATTAHRFGDGTNQLLISGAGVVTLEGTAKRWLAVRPDLDYTVITAQGKPTQVVVGVFHGYSMPVYAAGEELFFNLNVPGRWDEASDILVHVLVALSGAEDVGDYLKFQLSWEHMTEGDVVPATSHDVEVEQIVLTDRNAQYSTYELIFTLDYDVDNPDDVVDHDDLGMRLRRIDATNPDVTNEIIVIDYHVEFQVDKMFDAEAK